MKLSMLYISVCCFAITGCMLTHKVANLPTDSRKEYSNVRDAYLLRDGKVLVNMDVIAKNQRDEIAKTSLRSLTVNTSEKTKFQPYQFTQCSLEIRDIEEVSVGSYIKAIDGDINDKYIFHEAPAWDKNQTGPVGILCQDTNKLVYRDSISSAEFYLPDQTESKVVYKFVIPHPPVDTNNNLKILTKAILFPFAIVADIATGPFQLIYSFYSLSAGAFN